MSQPKIAAFLGSPFSTLLICVTLILSNLMHRTGSHGLIIELSNDWYLHILYYYLTKHLKLKQLLSNQST